MLKRISIEGIKFPRLYIAENAQDVLIAQQNGIPYIKWKYGQEQLVKQLLRPTLERMFPGINWTAVLGRKKPVRSVVHLCAGSIFNGKADYDHDYDADSMINVQHKYDEIVDDLHHDWAELDENAEYSREVPIATGRRDCVGGGGSYEDFNEDILKIEDYVGDLSSYVDIDALQKLGLLPKFVGDIADCIKRNLNDNMSWTEGYNKKLGYPLGKFSSKKELPNLLIIDISASIPDGIAATMLTLADTLREQCNADLIITSRRSGYYPAGSELPKPQTLRDYYGRSNESYEFMGILDKYISGREFGHVISFGDYDSPSDLYYSIPNGMPNTKVHMVHHYHTGRWINNDQKWTGYARWVKDVCPSAKQVFNTDWCKVMNKNYKM